MHWLWKLLNTPKMMITPWQEIQLTIVFLIAVVLVGLGIGCVYHAVVKK